MEYGEANVHQRKGDVCIPCLERTGQPSMSKMSHIPCPGRKIWEFHNTFVVVKHHGKPCYCEFIFQHDLHYP